jgi:hypothetical protein
MSANATAATYQPGGSYAANKSVTLYAVWKANKIEIAPKITTNVLSDGTAGAAYLANLSATGDATIIYGLWSGTLPDGLKIYTDGIISGIPTQTGSWTFTVAATNNAGSTTRELTITVKSMATPAVTYIVSYDANGGGNAPSAQTKTKGQSIYLASDEPSREGYAFLGWSTSKMSTEPQYSAGQLFTKDIDAILYAVWSKVSNVLIGTPSVRISSSTLALGESVMFTMSADNATQYSLDIYRGSERVSGQFINGSEEQTYKYTPDMAGNYSAIVTAVGKNGGQKKSGAVDFKVNSKSDSTVEQGTTNNVRSGIVQTALSQIGNGGYTFYNWYNKSYTSYVPWCAMFVSWCADQTGVLGSAIPKFAAVWSDKTNGYKWFENRGQWKDYNYTPEPGDIIYIDNDGFGGKSRANDCSHVGIVVSYNSATKEINTVEGNLNNKVDTRTYKLGAAEIWGYGVPNYTSSTEPTPFNASNLGIHEVISNSATVYAAPNTKTKIGSIGNETVDVLWYDGDYAYIQYDINNSNSKKCGFVSKTAVKNEPARFGTPSERTAIVASAKITTYAHFVYDIGLNTENNTNTSYISSGDTVTVYHMKYNVNGRVFVRYPANNDYKYGWCEESKLNINNTSSANAPVANGTYKIITAMNGIMCVDESTVSTVDGGKVHLYNYIGNANQQLTAKHIGDGWYTLTFVHSGKNLNVEGGKTSSTNVIQYHADGTDAERWKFEDAGGGYYYIKSALGKYLTVPGRANAGDRLSVASKIGDNSHTQKFKLDSVIPAKIITPISSTVGQAVADYALSLVGNSNIPGGYINGVFYNELKASGNCQRFVFRVVGLVVNTKEADKSKGDAKAAYEAWCVSRDKDNIPIGAAVYFDT